MPSHKHLHLRQVHQHWHDLVQGVENVANDLNPFKDGSHDLRARAPETVYKTVYTTMSADFDGPIAGYTTVGVPAETTRKPHTGGDHVTVAESKESSAAKPDTHKAHESVPESLAPTKSVDLDGESTLAVAGTPSLKHQSQIPTVTGPASSLGPVDANAAAASSSSPSSTPSPASTDIGPAAKAGIAIGVLGGLLAVALLVFFLFSRRRKQLEQQRAQENEKANGPIVGGRTASIHSTPTSATAPQLSLRPVTQFNPTFNERRSSKGAGLMLSTAAASQRAPVHEKGGSMWERPSTAHSTNPENPFNDTARAHSPTGHASSASQAPASNPFDSPEHVVGMAQTTDLPTTPTTPTGTGTGAVAVAAAAAAAVGTSTSLTRKASMRNNAPEPLDLTMPVGPPSPTGTDFSVNSVAPGQSPGPSKSAAAIAEAGGPPSTAVHRVQLDFKPSMDDELELQAGHLVRILHEYDDGWVSRMLPEEYLRD